MSKLTAATRSAWRRALFAAALTLAIAAPAAADLCLVPVVDGQSKCVTEPSPCSALAGETANTENPTITIQHVQESRQNPTPITLDLCYQPDTPTAVGGYFYELEPEGLLEVESCKWRCGYESAECEGWSGVDARCLCLPECSNITLVSVAYLEEAGTQYPPDDFPTGNVIISRFSFPGVDKPTAQLDENARVPETSIARIAIINGEIASYESLAIVAGKIYALEIMVVTQVDDRPFTPMSVDAPHSCAPAVPAQCADDNKAADATVKLNWTAASKPCLMDDCGNIIYKVYRGAPRNKGGVMVDCADVAAQSCEETVSGAITGESSALDYYIYSFTSKSGFSRAPLHYSVPCDRYPYIEFPAGWSFTGMSTIPADGATAGVFKDKGVRTFDFSGGKLIEPDTPPPLEAGKAYWLYSETSGTRVVIQGAPPAAPYFDIALAKGWNSFSNPFAEDVTLDGGSLSISLDGAVFSPPAGTALLIFDYDAANQRYQSMGLTSNAKLEPWKGYWVKAEENCTLRLANPSGGNNP